MKHVQTDVLVIGSGIAGLSYALKASEHGSVAVITKKRRADSSTNWAQGGVAAVFDPADSVALHARDTFTAGCGLCHGVAVRTLVREGPARVRELVAWGVEFTRDGRVFSLGREGGHSHRRILHAEDLTGREIERALLAALSERENVSLLEDHIAVDFTIGTVGDTGERRCTGAIALDHVNGHRLVFDAAVTLLAAGGTGQLYRHTTNPDIATGDGVAMAYRAGARIANLEFVQFHPTALYPAAEHAFLISEAVRGEGAVLRRQDGTDLMEGVHKLGSLAPRDIVARTIDLELKRSGSNHVLLDLSPIPSHTIEERFPGILAECASRGIDMRREPVPVVPAAHYACGGAMTDAHGRTSIPGLYAAGEVACTGVHGANRLASNSLLEAVVYSHRAAAQIPGELARRAVIDVSSNSPGSQAPGRSNGDRSEARKAVRDGIRTLMWDDVGIVRETSRLDAAASAMKALRRDAEQEMQAAPNAPDALELRNIAETAALVIECARQRRESRGLHHNLDIPFRDNERQLHDTVLVRRDER
jgi:L-aspartate oxidase